MNRDAYIRAPLPIQKDLERLFDLTAPLIIFDVGSCEGEDAIRYSRLFPNATIYAFEPVPENQALIRENLAKYQVRSVHLFEWALSDRDGSAKFHVSSGEPKDADPAADWTYGNKSSSLLPPDKCVEFHPWLNFKRSIDVPTRTLATVCDSLEVAAIDFMHLDVQGAELQVLRGAADKLQTCKAIWLEVETVALYADQPLKGDIEDFMCKAGFRKFKESMAGIAGDQLYLNKRHFASEPIWRKLLQAVPKMPFARKSVLE